MSELFPNEVYVPTGQADGKDFVKISGYCYKKVSDNITVLDSPVTSIFSDNFEDCLDCNSCHCGKQIDFLVGGVLYSGSDINYAEKTFSITTSSTGWQEIAIESGNLNINPSTNKPDELFKFKPLNIKCYDRKIDISGGLYASFEDSNAEIAHFRYVTGSDLYERRNLKSTVLGPDWGYQNQYDEIGYANKIKSIKFRSLCEYDCPTQDITFRVRGTISESVTFVDYGNRAQGAGGRAVSSWMYITCTGMPQTPGQIVECIPSGNGINLTDYFVGSFAPDSSYSIEMDVDKVEVVNLPLLLGETGSENSKFYSVSGSGMLAENLWFGSTVSSYTSYLDPQNRHYHLNDGSDDIPYSQNIGIPLGINYNRFPNCSNDSLTGSEFNNYYRHVGGYEGNVFASFVDTVDYGSTDLEAGNVHAYTGCFQTSEYIDGKYKIGTYNFMQFTGMINGNDSEYLTFIDDSIGTAPASWSSGVYVYQWYKSGDQSNPNDNIEGFFGFLHDLDNIDEQLAHYKSVASNHSPINIGDPLVSWNIISGNFPPLEAEKVNSSIIFNFGTSNDYQVRFSMQDGAVRHYALRPDDTNVYDNYFFLAGSEDSAINYLNEPEYSSNTFIETSGINSTYLLIDSGNENHNPNAPIAPNALKQDIKSIKFQLSWDK